MTHTLQYNLTPTKGLESLDIASTNTKSVHVWPKDKVKLPYKSCDVEKAKDFITDIFEEEQKENGYEVPPRRQKIRHNKSMLRPKKLNNMFLRHFFQKKMRDCDFLKIFYLLRIKMFL